jgi:predicted RNase H-like nuclease (RuvC/YqgF family)
MTKEELEKKLEGLRKEEAQALANFQTIRGARQFCEHLLKELAEKDQTDGS